MATLRHVSELYTPAKEDVSGIPVAFLHNTIEELCRPGHWPFFNRDFEDEKARPDLWDYEQVFTEIASRDKFATSPRTSSILWRSPSFYAPLQAGATATPKPTPTKQPATWRGTPYTSYQWM